MTPMRVGSAFAGPASGSAVSGATGKNYRIAVRSTPLA
jgi:hypothetical protein